MINTILPPIYIVHFAQSAAKTQTQYTKHEKIDTQTKEKNLKNLRKHRFQVTADYVKFSLATGSRFI